MCSNVYTGTIILVKYLVCSNEIATRLKMLKYLRLMNLGITLLEKHIMREEAIKLIELLVWLHPEKNETE